MAKWESRSLFPRYYPSRLPQKRQKNIRLHLQAHSYLLLLLFAFNHQNYARYLTTHHNVEWTNLSKTKPQAFSDLETFSLGPSLNGNKYSTIPGDLVTEVTINREVKVRGGSMRGRCSTAINAQNDFILNSQIQNKIWTTNLWYSEFSRDVVSLWGVRLIF